MTKDQFEREKHYQTTLAILRFMLKEGLISASELREMDKILLAKYRPLLGTLYGGNP